MKNNSNNTSFKKLSLSKETLRQLDGSDLAGVRGGRPPETAETQCAQPGCTGTHPTYMSVC